MRNPPVLAWRVAASASALLCVGVVARGEESVYRNVNPDLLSGGLYAALESAGVFGPRAEPARARATYVDLSKGRPPAVLEPRVGANLRLGDDPDALPSTQRAQVEPHIVRSFANPNVLLATFQEGRFSDAGALTCGYSVSHDDGITWRRALTPNLTTLTGGRFNRATDPVAGAGPQGDLYLQALVSVQGAFSLAGIVVSRSTDLGATWSAPAVVFESNTSTVGPDKNWLAVNDYPDAPNPGRLVSTWTNFLRNVAGNAVASPLVASISDDRGVTWSTPIEITPSNSNNQGTQPVFLPDGSLVVIYVSFLDTNNAARFSIHCKRSLDGGRTFPTATTTVVPFVNGWDDPQLRDGVFLPSAAVARSTGQLYVTYTAVVDGTPRVHVTSSTDQGATWSTPVVVSDQPAGVSVMNPVIAADPFGGAVAVMFADKRHAPAGRDFVDHYAALYRASDRTWLPNVRLSEMSSDIRFGPATTRGVMLGDYLGLAPPDSWDKPYVAIWSDTRTGDADPFTVRFMGYRPLSGSGQRELPYTDWTAARFSPAETPRSSSNEDADPDGDGATNLAEFVLGTNPRVPEYGDAIVLTRRSPTLVETALAVRNLDSIGGLGVELNLAALSTSLFGDAALLPNEFTRVPSPSDIPLAPGLRWSTAQHQPDRAAIKAEGTAVYSFSRSVVTTLRSPLPGSPTSSTDSRLINLSTRGRTGTDASQMIVGFVIDGNKSILLRAAGPALSSLGVVGAIADPQLTLTAAASDLGRTNDNWQTSGATPALFARLGAFPFANASLDSALSLELGAQNYTTLVPTTANTGGVTLVEVYDADATPGVPGKPRLLNLSTRGEVGPGDATLIAGFVLSGTQPRRILLRAVGPSLAALGIPGALRDPVLTLHRGDTQLARNDDWELSRSGAAATATAQRVGAFTLQAASLDAALLLTLEPGPYTAIVSSADGSSGIVLVEVYDAD